MSAGFAALMIAAVLVYCGLLQRVLDRMYLTDRQALVIILMMLIGTFLPPFRLGLLSINIGGAIIPCCVCVYIFVKCDEKRERIRAVAGALLTAVAVCAIAALLPEEAEKLPLDPMWIYGASGGAAAWLLGRSRRAAFISGTLGILIADICNAVMIWYQGYQTQLYLGGAGIADAAVISGVIAVMLCELVGEIIERFARRRSLQEGSV